MNARDIIKTHLIANGYGGLVQPDAECGCTVDELVPCDSDCSECQPGYKHIDPRDPTGNAWAIWLHADAPTDEQWDGMEAP